MILKLIKCSVTKSQFEISVSINFGNFGNKKTMYILIKSRKNIEMGHLMLSKLPPLLYPEAEN